MLPETHPEGDLTKATVEHLLDLAKDGDQAAAAELDRRGVEPEMLEPDDDVVAAVTVLERRNVALLTLAAHAGGRTVVGVEIHPTGVGHIVFSGGLTLLLEPDGGLALLDEHEPAEVIS